MRLRQGDAGLRPVWLGIAIGEGRVLVVAGPGEISLGRAALVLESVGAALPSSVGIIEGSKLVQLVTALLAEIGPGRN
jgi:hypothetical protein